MNCPSGGPRGGGSPAVGFAAQGWEQRGRGGRGFGSEAHVEQLVRRLLRARVALALQLGVLGREQLDLLLERRRLGVLRAARIERLARHSKRFSQLRLPQPETLLHRRQLSALLRVHRPLLALRLLLLQREARRQVRQQGVALLLEPSAVLIHCEQLVCGAWSLASLRHHAHARSLLAQRQPHAGHQAGDRRRLGLLEARGASGRFCTSRRRGNRRSRKPRRGGTDVQLDRHGDRIVE